MVPLCIILGDLILDYAIGYRDLGGFVGDWEQIEEALSVQYFFDGLS